MKKLLFVLAFTFIGQQAFSQMYIVVLGEAASGGCQSGEIALHKTNPTGSSTIVCIEPALNLGALDELNIELNSVINLGYKLVETSYLNNGNSYGNGLINTWGSGELNIGTSFIFAIP